MPPNITGTELLQLSSRSLTEIYSAQSARARSDGEGARWVEVLDGRAAESYALLGKDLYLELRHTMQDTEHHAKARALSARGEQGGKGAEEGDEG